MAELAEAIADDFLRRAVHRRGVDQTPSFLEKGAHDLGARIARRGVVADVERDPAAEPDGRKRLAARRDRASADRSRAAPRQRTRENAPGSKNRNTRGGGAESPENV